MGIVVSGRAAVRIADGEKFVMEPGDVFSMPAGHAHRAGVSLMGWFPRASRSSRPRPSSRFP
ncbi:MAG: cupin domain-containing protein [Actinobacteria bacterium]|nr:cupin domain-containing protein [Actinomycetota bacterium]